MVASGEFEQVFVGTGLTWRGVAQEVMSHTTVRLIHSLMFITIPQWRNSSTGNKNCSKNMIVLEKIFQEDNDISTTPGADRVPKT